MQIRPATDADFEAIWAIFQPIAVAGETYGYDRDISREQAYELWMRGPRVTYVAEREGEVLATYYLKTNQAGPGNHVCNCGYMVAPAARGQGLASDLCRHSQQLAVSLGYRAMQFNFVAVTNTTAVKLWSKLDFQTVGRLPMAFCHPTQGYVDALVMYKWLDCDPLS
ncbi:Ribosomal protein S18 acetylase RimI [Ferrimonas sediminum]|uniref:Ribosomal protein S18 acetylase RimI n=1 Tax=Ferrimonas sediminum TaxID=718193 RepID=A0A1G8LYJ3_9GAMM|nr:N-acetyltransferase [Ferrimonas sediminum]SDI60738.1 Ribosomal protein S18 acetylase RimI [Ferrimonas sediminum]